MLPCQPLRGRLDKYLDSHRWKPKYKDLNFKESGQYFIFRMISDPVMSSPGLTSESDSVGYQRVIDNSPRRLVIETLALPKNETLIENFETKTKCFLCDLEFDLNIERYYSYRTSHFIVLYNIVYIKGNVPRSRDHES